MNHAAEDKENLPTPGRFIESRPDGSVVIEVDNCELLLWNHEPERLAEAAAASGGLVEYQPHWGLLWVPNEIGRYAFCVVSPGNHVPCPLHPPVGSPVELLESAGGFTVPASELREEIAVGSVAYYSDWKNMAFTCPCGWQGLGSESDDGWTWKVLGDRNCPKCHKELFVVEWPTRDETEAAAAAGNSEALREKNMDTPTQYWSKHKLTSTSQLPDLDDKNIFVELTTEENANPPYYLNSRKKTETELCLLLNGAVFHREPVGYESIEPLEEMLPILHEKYGKRLASIFIAEKAFFYLLGDDWSMIGKYKEVLRKNGYEESQEPRDKGKGRGEMWERTGEPDSKNPVVDLESWSESYGSGFLRFLVDERLAIPGLRDEARLTVECDLAEVEFSLSKILDHLKSDARRWILIIRTLSGPRLYVQVLVTQEGGLWAECVSDFYLEEFELSEEQREALPALGWEWPSPPAKENWHFHDELMNTGSTISGLLVRTLRTVFHCDDNDPLEVLVFLSSNTK